MKLKMRPRSSIEFAEIKPGETFRNVGGAWVYLRGSSLLDGKYSKYNAINLVNGEFCRFQDEVEVERVNGTFVEGEE